MVGEMAEGSDVSGSEIGMEVGAGGGENEKDGIWHTQKVRRKRKKTRKLTESSQSDKAEVHSAGVVEVATEFKVVVKLVKEGESLINGIRLSLQRR